MTNGDFQIRTLPSAAFVSSSRSGARVLIVSLLARFEKAGRHKRTAVKYPARRCRLRVHSRRTRRKHNVSAHPPRADRTADMRLLRLRAKSDLRSALRWRPLDAYLYLMRYILGRSRISTT